MATITSIEQLRSLYAQPTERALKKQLAHLDKHCRSFIALSPYLVLCTSDAQGNLDASPRGGPGRCEGAGGGQEGVAQAHGRSARHLAAKEAT